MGLENGIRMKAKTSAGIKYIAENKDFYFDDDDNEIAYWRKCWNIKRVILDTFSDKGYDGNGGHIDLTTVADLVDCAEALKYFLDESNWDDSESIWEWYIQLPMIAMAIKRLRVLIEDIEDGEISIDDLNTYFYDSF